VVRVRVPPLALRRCGAAPLVFAGVLLPGVGGLRRGGGGGAGRGGGGVVCNGEPQIRG
jgi:hypothetical protein